MRSLKEIKEELKQMLIGFSVVKTNEGVLEYEGEELAVGTVLTVVDEENPEVKEIANGEYVLEDGRTLVIAEGELKEIIEAPEVQPVEVVEEPTEEETPAEEVAEPEVVEENPAEEVVEEPTEEETEPEVAEPSEVETKVAELEKKVAELEAKIAELVGSFEKMSLAKPVTEEFENVKTPKKTGNAKLDKFLSKYGN